MDNKIKIPMGKILKQRTGTLISGENTGQLVIERNLDYMKNWSEDEISEIFDDEGNLKTNLSNRAKFNSRLIVYKCKGLPRGLTAKHKGARVDMVQSTRKQTIVALKLIFKDEICQNSKIEMPSQLKLGKMAKDLISEENIRNKFEDCFIEYDPNN